MLAVLLEVCQFEQLQKSVYFFFLIKLVVCIDICCYHSTSLAQLVPERISLAPLCLSSCLFLVMFMSSLGYIERDIFTKWSFIWMLISHSLVGIRLMVFKSEQTRKHAYLHAQMETSCFPHVHMDATAHACRLLCFLQLNFPLKASTKIEMTSAHPKAWI